MLKRLRTAHPIVFCVLAEVVFLASLFVTDLIFTIVLVLLRADFSALDTIVMAALYCHAALDSDIVFLSL